MVNQVLCLMGPTASGKTALACEWVKQLPCEIISVDSALIYRGMDIGTAKPDAETLAKAPHHLLDILDPTESYSAAQFCEDARRLCDAIIQRGKTPLLVGGTMMYFRALQQGLSILPEADSQVRQQLLQQAQTDGWDVMHQRLSKIDPVAAARIHPHDTQRIQRALEVHAITGRSLSSCQEVINETTPPSDYTFVNIQLIPSDRSWLHQRIDQRFDQMLKEGFIEEVERLLQQWNLTVDHPALRCVGYRQVYEYLQGAYDYDTLRAKGAAATRQLAKRQLTWLRHWPDGMCLEAKNLDINSLNLITNIERIMSERTKQAACSEKKLVVHHRDLPLSCPTDAMELWNAHPKVYLPIEQTGSEVCPYCGTHFVLQDD